MIGSAKVEKRNRPPKSCEPCRARKLKCNRALPCDSCIRRGKQAICQYASNADRNEKRTEKGENVAERLKTLENLIATMAQKTTQKDPMASLTINERLSPTGYQMQGSDVNTETASSASSAHDSQSIDRGDSPPSNIASHLDSNHWSSILENIRAIRDEWPTTNSQPQPLTVGSFTTDSELNGREDVDFDLGSSEGLDIQQILSVLPPRQVCDSLISIFFRSHYTMMPILHPVKFQEEAKTPTIWIALLFALLSLSAGVRELSGMGQSHQVPIPSSKTLSRKTQQCLVLGNYIACKEHAVEALLVHLVGCWLRAKVSDTNLWFLMGKVVQLAISKGYHRDSAKVPGSNISPFDGEMRRRVWVCMYQLDSLMSFQMGLPSMIPISCCDTELPHNLDNSDFYPGITELPPSRPLSDNTIILYSIVKASVMTMFKKVVGHTRSLVSLPYEETITLDGEVRHVYDNIPNNFKYKTLRNIIMDDTSMIMGRTTIELLHLKSILVLHRQYLTHRQNNRFAFSRDACLEAAERLLERQTEMHQITQPGGQLHDMKWMVTTLTMSDFTLAAMVICLDLTVRMRPEAGITGGRNNPCDVMKHLQIIENTYQIWAAAAEGSSEARIVAHALDSTIQRVHEYLNTASAVANSQTWQSPVTDIGTLNYKHDSADHMSDINMTEFIDWSLLDNQLQDPQMQDFDLDLWLMDSAGPLETFGSL
ncbi:hypothetical protein FSARC_14494 [Fusarium sarcochroum]|uniref:Zn(2)-C6 fungal-type domain-containing protein n=1 Tax=Fusarium sarcochroum TaxID=1208366 RepID=A0A8H4WPI8_9HYPO|nr:hypothetical protein FSARC_14494 [Fusarium sarcochroum]